MDYTSAIYPGLDGIELLAETMPGTGGLVSGTTYATRAANTHAISPMKSKLHNDVRKVGSETDI